MAPGQAQERQAVACSQSEEGGRCCTSSRNLELAPLSSWAGCLGRVAALLRHDRAERAAIEWHKRRRKWWGRNARRAHSVVVLRWESGELSRSGHTRSDGRAVVVAWERGANTTLSIGQRQTAWLGPDGPRPSLKVGLLTRSGLSAGRQERGGLLASS